MCQRRSRSLSPSIFNRIPFTPPQVAKQTRKNIIILENSVTRVMLKLLIADGQAI